MRKDMCQRIAASPRMLMTVRVDNALLQILLDRFGSDQSINGPVVPRLR
ncbi:hypothetical protein BAURA86_02386 [Brevibacterium aurantiacum]|uniref:Uncharacterized protein n=1 Tax=Brevibacterium aurantiacum TaxID=273384 RepID=A0A2H1K3Y2_BREAU|nr:hypothetical protein BSP239C_02516 [Brevibacterium sp. 239c]SMX94495.1 hypothetical protein BAURA86_02386 [Brevibacterium aurantiacum]